MPRLFHDRRRLRIGLFGGSFNPAHDGHLHLSDLAQQQLRLDEVWWLVSPQNPLKGETGMASLANRLAAARNLVARRRRVRVIAPEVEFGSNLT
ncbi:MAG: nicotinic acid mononucleotide adenylyltransferase, partial [Rhodobiaceae bacterium]